MYLLSSWLFFVRTSRTTPFCGGNIKNFNFVALTLFLDVTILGLLVGWAEIDFVVSSWLVWTFYGNFVFLYSFMHHLVHWRWFIVVALPLSSVWGRVHVNCRLAVINGFVLAMLFIRLLTTVHSLTKLCIFLTNWELLWIQGVSVNSIRLNFDVYSSIFSDVHDFNRNFIVEIFFFFLCDW